MDMKQLEEIEARLTGKLPYGPYPTGISTTDDIRALLVEVKALRARVSDLEGGLWDIAELSPSPSLHLETQAEYTILALSTLKGGSDEQPTQ